MTIIHGNDNNNNLGNNNKYKEHFKQKYASQRLPKAEKLFTDYISLN